MAFLNAKEMSVKGGLAKSANRPLATIGNGPWLIDPECPNEYFHNRLDVARGSAKTGGMTKRCICPRAGVLLADHSEKQAAQRKARRRAGVTDGAKYIDQKKWDAMIEATAYMRDSMATATRPDLKGAACGSETGQRLSDRAMRNEVGASTLFRELYCGQCPFTVRMACGKWAIENESAATPWPGVYGGMTGDQRDRVRLIMDAA